VPMKSCPYDCIYCQLGPTRSLTVRRQTFAPVASIVDEVRRALDQREPPDAITLAGSGEPTLYRPMGALITALKAVTKIPVVLLTNGALFPDADLRREAALADRVMPSLDAGDEEFFRFVNRPHDTLTLENVVAGLEAFRAEYAGPIWLEVMVVARHTDRNLRLQRIAKQARRIRPDRIQLNTPVRPGRLGRSGIVERERLGELCALFTPKAEVIADFKATPASGFEGSEKLQRRLLDLLARRPCTLDDAVAGLSAPPNAVVKALTALQAAGLVREKRQGPQRYFAAASERARP
jgi:wyosine [tRNA(Phe)-imidazoG37] synthetase (radical SAM superfamily)